MRYIDVTIAEEFEKRRLYIGESAFYLRDIRPFKFMDTLKEQVAKYEEYVKTDKRFEDKLIDAKAQLAGSTVIEMLPRTLLSRDDMHEYRLARDGYGLPLQPLFVTETVEEIHKLMEEADVREYRKMYLAFKQIRALEDEGLV